MLKREIIFITLLLLIGVVRFLFFIPDYNVDYNKNLDKKVSLIGIIDDVPDKRIYNQRLVVRPKNQDFNILITVNLYSDFSYGDEVKIIGILEKPQNFITQSGKEFNYVEYLANQNIYYLIKYPEIEIISKSNGNFIKKSLFRLKENFMENIKGTIGFPENNLMNGILLGTRAFDQNQNNEFISTGTIHIIALSGYNVTVVAEGIMKVFSLVFSRITALSLGILGIILFVILTGAQATAVRAGVMALIALFARMTGKTYQAGRALLFAGLFMFAYDPRVITELSFQLSFIATIGVIFFAPKVEKWLFFIPNKFKIRDLISVTLAANIIVLPLILYSTGIFSIVSLPANILILPLIPAAMFFGFLGGMMTFISSFIALPFSLVGHLILKYVLFIIHLLASLPFADFIIENFPWWLMGSLYLFLGWYIFKPDRNSAQ
ncbi:MAG: ComEC/Rec2 family competence protein [Patescibacteria group bacterium]|nr:ComEC/Rec2 family competence protein [Patescibacteria group bacterium]